MSGACPIIIACCAINYVPLKFTYICVHIWEIVQYYCPYFSKLLFLKMSKECSHIIFFFYTTYSNKIERIYNKRTVTSFISDYTLFFMM